MPSFVSSSNQVNTSKNINSNSFKSIASQLKMKQKKKRRGMRSQSKEVITVGSDDDPSISSAMELSFTSNQVNIILVLDEHI